MASFAGESADGVVLQQLQLVHSAVLISDLCFTKQTWVKLA